VRVFGREEMSGIFQDVRYAVRQLRKSPGFTAVAVITLALGIGATTAIFSNVNALILRPFALPNLDRVVAVWETTPKLNAMRVKAAPANFRDWIAQSTSFEHLAAVHGWNANLTGKGVAQRVEGYQVTSSFFSLLGVPAELGRNIGPADFQEGTAPVVVISYGFWQKHMGGDTAVVGKTLLLNGRKFTVAGVAGRDADLPPGAEIWAPLDLSSAGMDRANHYLLVLGRLKPQVSVEQATADLEIIARRLGTQFPETNSGHGVRVTRLAEDVNAGSRQFLMVLMGAAAFVLLLACVNVANLQLARVSSRQKEMAVRMGLGASRWQLVRQVMVESSLLAGAGAAFGLILSGWGVALLRNNLPPFIIEHVPGLQHVGVDARVLWFTLAVAFLSGILAGLAPALRFSRSQLSETLKENTRAASAGHAAGSLRSLLVISEVALALVLLVGAGLMVKGFRNLLNMEMGFDRTHVLTFHVALPEGKYQKKDQIITYYDRVVRQIRALPGVTSVACVSSLPSGWTWNWTEYSAEGQPPAPPGETPTTASQIVTPDFLAVMRVPLLRGRFISAEDRRDSLPVVVISETMARHNWPGQNPIGKHLKLGPRNGPETERQIVGVIGDIRPSAFDHNPDPAVYVPLSQVPPTSSAFVVRTSGDPSSLAAAVSTQVRNIDPDVPAYDVRSLEQVIADDASGVDSSAQIMLIFGLIALALAAAGIFAVMAYSVTQRTHEIGVRMALGARRGDVLRVVIASSLKRTAVGLAIGILVAALLTRALSSALYGVIRMDTLMFVLLTLLLAAVATVAAYVPARWATKVDPMQVLRCE
jgi:predicted permease